MTKGTQYIVSVKLTADDAEVRAAIASLSSRVAGGAAAATQKAVDHVRLFRDNFTQFGAAFGGFRAQLSMMTGIYRTATAAIGMGFTDIVKGAVLVNQEFEDMQSSLAVMLAKTDELSGGQFKNFSSALNEAPKLFRAMNIEAAKTGLEVDQLVEGFDVLLPFVRKFGLSLDEILKLSSGVSFWDRLTGRKGTSIQDVRQVLGGQLNPRIIQNPMLQNMLDQFAKIRDLAAKYPTGSVGNIKAKREMLALVETATKLSDEMKGTVSNTFSGRINQLKTELKFQFVEATQPIFEQLKGYVSELTAWAQTPEGAAKIKGYASDFAKFVKGAATTLYDVFKFFFDNFESIKKAFTAFGLIWAGKNILTFGYALVEFARIWKTAAIGDFIKALVGFKGIGAGAAAARAVGAVEGGAVGGAGAAAAAGGAARAVPLVGAGIAATALAALFLDPNAGTPQWDQAKALKEVMQYAKALGIYDIPASALTEAPGATPGLTRLQETRQGLNQLKANMDRWADQQITKGDYSWMTLPTARQELTAPGASNAFPDMGRATTPTKSEIKVIFEIRGGKLVEVGTEASDGVKVDVGGSAVGNGADL